MQEFVNAFEGTKPMIRSGDESDTDSIPPPTPRSPRTQVLQAGHASDIGQDSQARQEPHHGQEPRVEPEPQVRVRRSQRQLEARRRAA
jgi:hypothetical protein